MPVESHTARSLHVLLSVLGAFTGVASVIGMLTGAVWTVSTISADLAELGRRMGLVEVQLGTLSGEVGSLRAAVRELRAHAPSRHAEIQPSPRPAASAPGPGEGVN